MQTWRKGVLGRQGTVVLFDFLDWEITLREVVFSALIAGVMTAIGFGIAAYVGKRADDAVLKYRQAAQITAPSEFRHAMDTDVGTAFVEGDGKALDPVSHPELKGSYLAYEARWQKYTMHTRLVTTTDSKGRTHTHTRTYWTWDTYDSKSAHAKRVRFCGNDFPYGAMNYNRMEWGQQIANIGYHRRIVFDTLPASFRGTLVAELRGGAMEGQPVLWQNWNTAGLYEYHTTSHAVLGFWILWIILTGLALWCFYWLDNDWLEEE